MNKIEVLNFSKKYGKFTAVKDISFEVLPGVVTGLLGPNGSGKSTTMRSMVGLERPTSGKILIDGVPYRKLKDPLRKLGVMIDPKTVHASRSAYDHLKWLCDAAGLSEERVEVCLDLTGLTKVACKKVGDFSLGMAQRVGIAAAFLGLPKYVMFDEPVNGLDPAGVRWVRDICRAYASGGNGVILSSHLMSEMAKTADNLVIIAHGNLLETGTISDIKQKYQNDDLEDIFISLTSEAAEYNAKIEFSQKGLEEKK
jgi:ABC-2 type transport system ATP-binding protein